MSQKTYSDCIQNKLAKAAFIVTACISLACESGPPPDITDPGELLFLGYARKDVNCARCHGPQGQGGMQAPSVQEAFKKHGEDGILDIIELGKGEGEDAMPPFEGQLSEEELSALLRFLRSVQKETACPR